MLVVLALLAALIISIFLLPSTVVPAGPYAVALVLAARRMSQRTVHLVSLIAIALYLTDGLRSGTSSGVLFWNIVALGAVGYIAGLLSLDRQTLEVAHQETRAAHDDLQRFLSLVAHDMGQPLTTITGYAQMLSRSEEGNQTTADAQAVEGIENAAKRLQRLTEDLRDAGAIGTRHFAVQKQEADLAQLLRQVVKQQAATAQHRIELTTPDEMMGSWDVDRLSQLFGNLIGNAIKYSPEGEPIQVDAYRLNSDAIVTISDQGIGMSSQEQDRLFQPFSRVHTDTSDGTGLGLFICKGIVDAHGGEIWVASQPSAGSTFSVRLPLRQGDDAAASAPRRHPVRLAGSSRQRRRRAVQATPPSHSPEPTAEPAMETGAPTRSDGDQPPLS